MPGQSFFRREPCGLTFAVHLQRTVLIVGLQGLPLFLLFVSCGLGRPVRCALAAPNRTGVLVRVAYTEANFHKLQQYLKGITMIKNRLAVARFGKVVTSSFTQNSSTLFEQLSAMPLADCTEQNAGVLNASVIN